MSNIQVFEYGDRDIRTFVDENRIPWFAAKDIAQALGYAKFDSNLIKHVPEEWKGTKRISTPGGDQVMNCLSEQGLYFFLSRSDKERALPFQKWIAGEVVPSIRKHGMYATPQTVEQLIKDPDTMISVLQELKKERNERQALAYENRELRPKAEFYDAVAGSKTAIDIGKVAKVLNFRNLGRNRLFAFLRDHSILTRENIPYQEYIDRGYFRTIEQKFTTPDGETRISIKTVVFQRGVDFIRKLLIRHGFESEHMQMVQSR